MSRTNEEKASYAREYYHKRCFTDSSYRGRLAKQALDRLNNNDGAYRNEVNVRKRKRHIVDPRTKMLNSARTRAKEQSVPFDLSKEDIVIPDICPVLGIPLVASKNGSPSSNSPSLDKIVPSDGYVKGNVAVISFRANALKSNATVEELQAVINWMKAVTPTA